MIQHLPKDIEDAQKTKVVIEWVSFFLIPLTIAFTITSSGYGWADVPQYFLHMIQPENLSISLLLMTLMLILFPPFRRFGETEKGTFVLRVVIGAGIVASTGAAFLL